MINIEKQLLRDKQLNPLNEKRVDTFPNIITFEGGNLWGCQKAGQFQAFSRFFRSIKSLSIL